MYLIPLIRDFIEFLNNVFDSMSSDINFQSLIQQSLIFLAQQLKFIFLYFISFQWFRDFFYLSVLIPQCSDSILRENFFLETPLLNIVNFSDISSLTENKFFIGFLNSLFLSLPFSCSHLLYLRRFFIQGNFAGICAGLGHILGQISFISSVLFGLRFFIIPWFSFEPFIYFIGVFVLVNIVYDLIHEHTLTRLDWRNRSELLKIFFLNFFLIWTEQSCIFQYLGNLTFNAQPTSLEIFSGNFDSNFFINNFNYIFGLIFGCFFFTIIFTLLLKKFLELIENKFFLLKSTFRVRLNFLFLSCILAFTFTSIPFYGLDFLITSPLGFISEDKGLNETFLFKNRVKDPFNIVGDEFSIYMDLKRFDRGVYLEKPLFESFESLNYPLDYASLIKQGSLSLDDEYKEKARQIREIIFKKKESINENLKLYNTKNNENLKTKKGNKDIFVKYPTSFSNLSNPKYNNILFNIQTRFDLSYKKSPAFVFRVFFEYTLNRAFWKQEYSLVYPEFDRKIKQKIFNNPIFKFLLNIDIDNIIKRQPSDFLLSSKQEKDLYKKRLILSRYYDTLRLYKKISYVNEFESFFNGSKSFATRVYNQQFKGTLRVVRRLFFIKTSNMSFSRKVKYDRLLLKNNIDPEKPKETTTEQLLLDFYTKRSILDSYNEELKKLNTNIDSQKKGKKEELLKKTELLLEQYEQSDLEKEQQFDLESDFQRPLYMGWDKDLKKIILTNRYISRSNTSFLKPLFNDKKTIFFTTWPILDENLTQKEILQRKLKYSLLYKKKKTIENLKIINPLPLFAHGYKRLGLSSYTSLPNNILQINTYRIEIPSPNRGGFVWPGTSNLKLSFDQFQN